MARASASTELSAPPEQVWRTLTDFRRYPEWLAFHKQWIDQPPQRAEVGATFTESVAILGPPAKVDWEIVTADPGAALELTGRVATGVDARLAYRIAETGGGARLTVELTLTGGPAVGPIDRMIQKAAQEQLDKSLRKFPTAG